MAALLVLFGIGFFQYFSSLGVLEFGLLIGALSEDDPDAETAAGRKALAEALFRETEGNPFFIGEVINHLGEEGKIFRGDEGRWQTNVTSISELGIPRVNTESPIPLLMR